MRPTLISMCCGLLSFVGTDGLAAQEPAPRDDAKPVVNAAAERPADEKPAPVTPASGQDAPAPVEEPSKAETIARLQRTIEAQKGRRAELEKKLKDLDKEFEAASAAFKDLDAKLEMDRKRLPELRDDGKQAEADKLAEEIAAATKQWMLAKERFELAIGQRTLAQEQLTALEQKLEQDQQALKRLTEPAAATPPPDAPGTAPAPPEDAKPAPKPEDEPTEEKTVQPIVPGLPPVPATSTNGENGEKKKPEAPPRPEVEAAARELTEKEQKAQAAEKTAAEVEQRLEALDKNIELERKARDGARALAENSDKTLDALQSEYQKKLDAGTPFADLEDLRSQIAEANIRRREALADARTHSTTLDELQTERAALLVEHLAAVNKAAEERAAADEARRKLEALQSPFTPRNMLQWIYDHGPNLVLIVLVAFVLLWLVHVVGHRAARVLVQSGGRGTELERTNRAKTLVGVFQNTATLLIYVGGILMVLDEVGVPIIPLLGGAAIAGLAIAFGAQTLVKDYFYGFMILLENQYGVNDVIKIGDTAGLVERVTLRMTVLRDLEGVAHFIPHSSVTVVSNMTHGWSRAVFDIHVAFEENVDQVMEVLIATGKAFRKEPEFAYLVLDDPEMLGVDAIGEAGVVVKFMMKTRPLMQWTVKREMLRRIKNRFDEAGIRLTYPHRVVHYRSLENGEPRSHAAPLPSMVHGEG